MDYIFMPYLIENPLMYNTFPISNDTIVRGRRGPSHKLVHEYSKDVIIAE